GMLTPDDRDILLQRDAVFAVAGGADLRLFLDRFCLRRRAKQEQQNCGRPSQHACIPNEKRGLSAPVLDRKSTRLNSSHTVIYTLSLPDALPICFCLRRRAKQEQQNCGRPSQHACIPNEKRGLSAPV